MAPVSPMSMKRSTSPVDLGDDGNARKRSKTAQSPIVEVDLAEDFAESPQITYTGEDIDIFNKDPEQLLGRSAALVLEHIGYHGASQEAIEGLCSEAAVYASMFLSKVTTSMITARRAVPTPTDFEYALQQMGLTTSSLEPHLRPPIPRDRLMIQLEPPSPTKAMTTSIEKLIGKDLSGELDKASRTYIPKHLPPFPSRHTYKWTEKDPIRETDARKIREEAAHQARQGEEALRRLIAVSKVGSEKDVRQLAEKDKRSKKRHQLWEQAVAEASNVPNARLTSVEKSRTQSKMVERSVVVNASSMYHRKGITGKRKGVPQLPPELLGS